MGIAFVAAADLGDNAGITTSLSTNYTCGSGADRLLVVSFLGDSIGGADDVTSVTYNGVAMTLGVKNSSGTNRYHYLYYLLSPDSGANAVVITCGSTHYILAVAGDYTGVQQTSQPDTTATSFVTFAGNTTLTTNFTTSTANAWVIFGEASFGTASTAVGNCVKRVAGASFGEPSLFDSGAGLSAGADSVTTRGDAGFSITHALVAFKPSAGAAAATYDTFLMMGV